jgi:hypothetical protein
VDGAFGFTDLVPASTAYWNTLSRLCQHHSDGAVGHAGYSPQYAYIEFGNVGSGSISGYKWNDADGDGVWIPAKPACRTDHPALPENRSRLPGDPDQTVTTGSDGNFEFTYLEPGTYKGCGLHRVVTSQTYPSTSGGCHEVTPIATNNFTASLPNSGPTSATSTMANGGQMLIEFVGVSGKPGPIA